MRTITIAACISFLLLGQLFFTYKSVETVPFFNYGMYSAIQNHCDSVAIIELLVDNEKAKITNLPLLCQEFLTNNIFYFHYHKSQNYNDDNLNTINKRFNSWLTTPQIDFIKQQLCNQFITEAQFNDWLIRYIQPFYKQTIKTVAYSIVYKTNVF